MVYEEYAYLQRFRGISSPRIKTQFNNFYINFKTSDETPFYNLEPKSKNRWLKPRLLQDLLLSDISEGFDEILYFKHK